MHSFRDYLGIFRDNINRRCFLKLGALATAVSVLPRSAIAALGDFILPERSLSFYNIHTGESMDTVYWAQGEYLPGALADINYVLRDFRTDGIKCIDTGLLDLLYALRSKLDTRNQFHIISGYRSPATNALLRRRRKGIAKNSLHITGMAADIRLPECNLSSLRKAAMDLRGGGVGYYPRSNFVHVDVGIVRYW